MYNALKQIEATEERIRFTRHACAGREIKQMTDLAANIIIKFELSKLCDIKNTDRRRRTTDYGNPPAARQAANSRLIPSSRCCGMPPFSITWRKYGIECIYSLPSPRCGEGCLDLGRGGVGQMHFLGALLLRPAHSCASNGRSCCRCFVL